MHRLLIPVACAAFLIGAATATAAERPQGTLFARLAGRLLIQTESRGELWYVSAVDGRRHLIGSPDELHSLYRTEGLGAANALIRRIPLARDFASGPDADGDGLPDALEDAIGTDRMRADTDGDGFTDANEVRAGYDPTGPGRAVTDVRLARRLMGRILLQVESRGEAWYVNPSDGLRYYLGDPRETKPFLGKLALGIGNRDLTALPSASPFAAPSGATECGEGWPCMIERARACRPAQLVWRLAADREGFTQHTTMVLEITGERDGRCGLTFTDARYDVVFPSGTAAERVREENARYDAVEGRSASCAYAPRELAELLVRWSQRLISSDDFTSGDCQGSYFGGE